MGLSASSSSSEKGHEPTYDTYEQEIGLIPDPSSPGYPEFMRFSELAKLELAKAEVFRIEKEKALELAKLEASKQEREYAMELAKLESVRLQREIEKEIEIAKINADLKRLELEAMRRDFKGRCKFDVLV